MSRFDVIILGGGAAGLFCAATAGGRGRRVLLIEHNSRVGNKILISGGGRCNFTNLGVTAANYITSGSPHFTKSALAGYTPADFLALVERHGIAWHEKKLGQLFCDHSSKQIVQLLEDECAEGGVVVRLNCRVSGASRGLREETVPESEMAGPEPSMAPAEFVVESSQGSFTAPSLVIATGGLSFPKLGATPFGYRVAEQFRVKVVPPSPGLVPLTLAPADLTQFVELSGLSLDCETRVGPDAPGFRENLLFTHRGLSGPAVLQISSYLRPGGELRINLLPDRSARELLVASQRGGTSARQALRGIWPERFLNAWCRVHAPDRPLAQWPRRELEALADRVHGWILRPAGDEGYPKAEVTVGGVHTNELSSKTFACHRVPGLYFIGEVVDVTGWLGGYNFQWAWASGYAAGQAV